MNRNITLAKRENEIAECVAWGGSYKETASLLQISVRTVDNTLRRIKEKLGLNKINEISAWWFRNRTEYRTRRQETSINQPYII